MKVKELIQELGRLDPEYEVLVLRENWPTPCTQLVEGAWNPEKLKFRPQGTTERRDEAVLLS